MIELVMMDARAYWSPLFELNNTLRFWVRVAWRDGALTEPGEWGQLLLMPVDGYLEGPDGPWPLRDVEWVDVSTSLVKAKRIGVAPNLAGTRRYEYSLKFIEIKDAILAGLQGTELSWELRESTWNWEGVFEERAVEVVRFVNPFGPLTRP